MGESVRHKQRQRYDQAVVSVAKSAAWCGCGAQEVRRQRKVRRGEAKNKNKV